MKLMHNERGMSVIWVALVLSLLGIYAAVGNTLVSERAESLGGIQQSEQSLYLAESGLKMAVETLENNWGTWDDAAAFPAQNLGGGSFDATVGNEGLIIASQNYYPLSEAQDYGSDAEDETSTDTTSSSTSSGDGGSIGDSSQIYKIVHAVADGQAEATVSVVKSKSISQSNGAGSSSSGTTNSISSSSSSSSTSSSTTVAGTYPDPSNSKKVLICHYPPGNPGNAHTISISKNAVSTHKTHHGDTDGPCVANNDPNKIDVIVQGNAGGSSRFIKATVSKYVSALHNAVYSTGMIYIQGDIPTMSSGKPVKTYYPASSSTSSSDPLAWHPSRITGYATQYASSFPSIDVTEAKELAKGNNANGMTTISNGNYFQGTSPVSLTSLNGVIFFDAGIGGSPASVNLSNVSTTSTDPALLIVRGNLFLSNVHFNGLIVVAEGSSVSIDNSVISGAVIANQMVNLTGGSSVTYNSYNIFSDNLEIALLDIKKPTVLTWKEYFPQ